MRYMLSFLLILSFSFGQKIVTMSETDDNGKRLEIKKEIKEDQMKVTITKDGESETFTANLDDEEAMEELNEKLAEFDPDDKIILHKNYKKHDCKKMDCDPAECKKSEKHCNDIVWNMKEGVHDKKMDKMILHHKALLDKEPAGYLGVHIQNLSDQLADYFKIKDGKGVLVSEVEEDSPAQKAGLKAGDIITKVDDTEIASSEELSETIKSNKPESKVIISVLRDGKNKKLNATLGKTDMPMFLSAHDLDMPPFPEADKFYLQKLDFDEEELKAKLNALSDELEELKAQFKNFREDN